MSRPAALKLCFNHEIHRIRVELSGFKLVDLHEHFEDTFPLTRGLYSIQYRDPEGDLLHVCSDAEFFEAIRVHESANDQQRAIKFIAVEQSGPRISTGSVEPIVSAIEGLVTSLNAAIDRVKSEEWAQTAQAQVNSAGHALNHAARGARESLSSARGSVNMEQFARETSESLRRAAEGIGNMAPNWAQLMYGKDTVPEDDIKKDKEPGELDDADEDKKEAEVVSENQQESALPSLAQSQVEVVPPSGTTHAVVPPPSIEELQWANELNMINDVLPGTTTERAITALRNASGNLEEALNTLMEGP